MAGIQNNTVPFLSHIGAGMGGIESRLGALGARVFRTCKGGVTRAARSLNRMISRAVHGRPATVPLVAAQAGSARRASIRKLDFPAVDASRFHGLQPSPGAVSSKSTPDCILRSRPQTPSSLAEPIPGVRLKPGRSAGDLPRTPEFRDEPPPLPRRAPRTASPWEADCAAAPGPASTPVQPRPAAPTLVFHRKETGGPPITARLELPATRPKPPGSDEPLR